VEERIEVKDRKEDRAMEMRTRTMMICLPTCAGPRWRLRLLVGEWVTTPNPGVMTLLKMTSRWTRSL